MPYGTALNVFLSANNPRRLLFAPHQFCQTSQTSQTSQTAAHHKARAPQRVYRTHACPQAARGQSANTPLRLLFAPHQFCQTSPTSQTSPTAAHPIIRAPQVVSKTGAARKPHGGSLQTTRADCFLRRTNTYPYLSVLIRTYPYKRRTITAVRHSGYTDPMPARKPHGLQIAEQRKVTELMTGIFLRFIFQ